MKTIFAGQPERIYIEYRDADNTLVDPTRPRVSIYDPAGTTIVSSAEALQESVGVYYYLFGVSTAYAVRRGTYQAWFEGFINGGPVYMDEPIYFDVMDRPVISGDTSVGRSFVRQIRNAIGDNFEDDYMISPVDLNYYIQDGVRTANATWNFGYDVLVSTSGPYKTNRIIFTADGTTSTSLSTLARTWYATYVVYGIMEAQARLNMFGTGNINAGDIRMNLSGGLREQTNYLKHLKEDMIKMEENLKMNGSGGTEINTYAIEDLWVSRY